MDECVHCRILQDKVNRMSAHLSAAASDCAQLQLILLDIGMKVRSTLGAQVIPRTTWQCICQSWNYPARDCCTSCGRTGDHV